MKLVQVLGTGCPKCQQLTSNVATAIKELGIECELKKVTDINEIIGFGVMMTPALAVDGKVVTSGKVSSIEEIKGMLG